jgi:pilus assembly protein CpaC
MKSDAVQAPQTLQPLPADAALLIAQKPDSKAQADPPAHDALPTPRPLPFPAPGCALLPEAETASPGSTPRPSKEVQEEFGKFIDRQVDPTNTLKVVVGRQTLLVLKQPAKKTQLPDEKTATAELLTPKELAVTGKEPGSTVLNLWFTDPDDATKEKILSYLVLVIEDPDRLERREESFRILQDKINRKFPDSVVRLTLLNNKLLVCGQAKDGFEAQQILRVIGVNVAQQPALPIEQVNLNVTAGPAGLPAGGLGDFLLETPSGEKYAVVNLLRVPGEQQVLLHVKVAEINRTAARSIGLNFEVFNKGGAQVIASTVGGIAGQMVSTAANVGTGGVSSAANNLPIDIGNGRLIAAVDALKNLDFARSLAEPTLTAINGQQASFQAGGEFPVPVVTGFTAAGLQGVTFVPFGVQLHFTPYITDKDLIRLAVSAEVSTLAPGLSATTGGAAGTPGLNTRNFQTTVELRSGQTLAVAGLIQNNFGADAARVPLFGEVPIFGRLFAFDKTSSGEQELIMLVTPELVHPVDPGECLPLPGGDTFEPGDLEFYLLGRLESRRPYDFRSPVMTELSREARYRHCEQIYIFGPQGYSDGKP